MFKPVRMNWEQAPSGTVRGSTSIYKCRCCGNSFEARTADRARGWALYCTKSCKATAQSRERNGLSPRVAQVAVATNDPEIEKKGPPMEPIEDWMIYKMFGIDMPSKSC